MKFKPGRGVCAEGSVSARGVFACTVDVCTEESVLWRVVCIEGVT